MFNIKKSEKMPNVEMYPDHTDTMFNIKKAEKMPNV
jgi:hypothetical protein